MKKFRFSLPIIIFYVLFLLSAKVFAADWQSVEEKNVIELSSDNILPVMYIETEKSRPVISRSTYVSAEMNITDGEESASYTIQIRGRGNSTWSLDKKPYKIKLTEKANLFGMGESRHWILLANAYDGSHLRNKLSYDLSGAMGMTAIESVYVNLVLNGEYMGLYQLTESIRAEKNRIPIYDWEDIAEDAAGAIAAKENFGEEETAILQEKMKRDLSWVTSGVFGEYEVSDYFNISRYSITGGYILELDEYYDEISKFTTPEDVPIMIKSPEYLNTNEEMFDYIRSWIGEMEEAMFSQDGYNSLGKHYSEYVDMESFVDYWIVNQVFKSVELLYKSCYMYKDAGGKLIFGPVWDMDWSSGNHANLSGDGADPCSWTHQYSQDREYWYRALYDQPSFIVQIQDRWWEIRPLLDEMLSSIDDIADEISPADENDREKWQGMEFEWEVNELRSWLTKRIEWMDEQLSLRDPNITGRGIEESRSYTISLSDENGNILPPDTISAENRRADFYYEGSTPIRVKVNTVTSYADYIDVYINGIRLNKVNTTDTIADFELEMSSLYTDGRRNVIHVIARSRSMPSTSAGEKYVTLLALYDEADGIIEENEPKPSDENDTGSNGLYLIIGGGCVIIIAFGYIILKKLRKSEVKK